MLNETFRPTQYSFQAYAAQNSQCSKGFGGILFFKMDEKSSSLGNADQHCHRTHHQLQPALP